MDLNDDLNNLRPALAAAAQTVYDSWVDTGVGGICTNIAKAMASVITAEISGVDVQVVNISRGHDGLEVTKGLESYRVDIPYNLYEWNPTEEEADDYDRTHWVKVPNVTIRPTDLTIHRTVPPR